MEGAKDFGEFRESVGQIKSIRRLLDISETIYVTKVGGEKDDRHQSNRAEGTPEGANFFGGPETRDAAGYTADLDGTPSGPAY